MSLAKNRCKEAYYELVYARLIMYGEREEQHGTGSVLTNTFSSAHSIPAWAKIIPTDRVSCF